jgi:NAD-dependent DNA ligase
MSDSGTPGWLKGLIIVFAFASAGTFGLYLYRHGEDAALLERYRLAKRQREELRVYTPKVEAMVAPLDQQIMTRRNKIASVAELESQTMQDVNRLVGESTVHTQALAKAMQDQAKKYKQVSEDAKTRRLELKQEEERALALERDFDKRRLETRDQIEALSKEVEGVKREARNANVVADLRIGELDERITQLTQQRELNNRELRTDGQVLASRATDGYVVIDRGQQNNLRKGTKFVIFNRRGGKLITKGAVEVIDVEARMATARVLQETDANDPIIPGDHLHNPVYNPADVKIFVLKGDFSRFSADELARFITESGAKVEKELTTASDYLVAGDRAQAALDQASKLGISILSEDQLLDFVRYEPRFALRAGMVAVLEGKFTQVNAGKIRDFVEKNGGKVEGRVRSGVNVLIAGEGASEEIAKARALGITVLDQSQFSYLNDKR